MKKIKYTLLLHLGVLCVMSLLMVACTAEDMEESGLNKNEVGLTLSRTTEISNLQGYLFDKSGKLIQEFKNITPSSNGQCILPINSSDDATLCLLDNADGLVTDNISSLNQLKTVVVGKSTENNNCPIWKTSEIDIKVGAKLLNADLIRSVARLDLKLCVSDVKVYEMKVTNLCDKSYLFPSSLQDRPDEISEYELKQDWNNVPQTQSKEGVFYIFEQSKQLKESEVILKVEINGRFYTLKDKLPYNIERNKTYTISVKGEGTSIGIEIEEDGWENGDESNAELDGRGFINAEESELLDNVSINKYKDTVKIGYIGTGKQEAIIALNKPTSGYFKIESDNKEKDSITISYEQGKCKLHIKSTSRYIGSLDNYTYVRHYDDKGVMQGQIVLNFEKNPIKSSGSLTFYGTQEVKFTDYIDGTMGVIYLPEGYSIKVNAPAYKDEQGAQWLRAIETEEKGAYRIVAGWRPNDEKANGQNQSGILTIMNNKGYTENYTITRPNWNLPVVKINDTWWCKYNLRGNVKKFEDQVSMADDKKIGKDLAFYLKSCDDKEYVSLVGGQYQAGNYDAMELKKDNDGKLYYEGYKSSVKADFGALPVTEMAPKGFQLPTYDDYRFFNRGDNENLGFGSGKFNNGLPGDKSRNIAYSINRRDNLKIGDIDYGDVYYIDFRPENENDAQWVLFSLGHQWEQGAGKISNTYMLFAVSGASGRTWGVQGANEGLWYKYSAHNAHKTRSIRCIKSPVEFIY